MCISHLTSTHPCKCEYNLVKHECRLLICKCQKKAENYQREHKEASLAVFSSWTLTQMFQRQSVYMVRFSLEPSSPLETTQRNSQKWFSFPEHLWLLSSLLKKKLSWMITFMTVLSGITPPRSLLWSKFKIHFSHTDCMLAHLSHTEWVLQYSTYPRGAQCRRNEWEWRA